MYIHEFMSLQKGAVQSYCLIQTRLIPRETLESLASQAEYCASLAPTSLAIDSLSSMPELQSLALMMSCRLTGQGSLTSFSGSWLPVGRPSTPRHHCKVALCVTRLMAIVLSPNQLHQL